jgi:hypothetical protein
MGVKGGVVVDLESVERALRHAIDAAERMAKVEVQSAIVSLSGGRLGSSIHAGTAALSGRPITPVDIERAVGAATANLSHPQRSIMHALPLSFAVDAAAGVQDPTGMVGSKLGCDLHVVSSDMTAARNLMLAVERCHVEIEAVVATPYASGLSSLVDGLLSQKADLQDRVLHDQRLSIYPGGRQDVAKGRVDVRVLAVMLYLAEAYHQVTVSCLISGHHLYARPGVVSAHIYGRAVDVAALSGISIFGHQQPGGITEQAVRSILMLPGGMLPAQVISLMGLGGPSFPLANHYDHIHVGY